MTTFQKGDILEGAARGRDEAFHPIVYLGGHASAPLAVMLTHSSGDARPCNKKLEPVHVKSGLDGKDQYFVAHRLQKLSTWAPYKKTGELTDDGIEFIESELGDGSETWEEYLENTKKGCPIHKGS